MAGLAHPTPPRGRHAAHRPLFAALAEYERLRARSAWRPRSACARRCSARGPYAEVVIAEVGGEPAGFALFFHNYSTFLAPPGIYLEDLFVRPSIAAAG